MVVFMIRYEVPPDRATAYGEWAGTAIRQAVAAPGVVELRAYRPLMAHSQVILTVEFARLDDWTTWYAAPTTQALLDDLGTPTLKLEGELWGPSPLVPEPIKLQP